MADAACLRALSAPRQLTLHIPYSESGTSLETCVETIDGVEAAAAELRRAASDRAADGASSDDDFDLEEEEAGVAVQTIHVQTLPVAATIGGKIWDASLLMAAWIAESAAASNAAGHFPPPPLPGGRAPRVLELGAGLGIVGIALAKACPHCAVTLSDYDPALLANLHENLKLNGLSPAAAAQAAGLAEPPRVEAVDFRDFARPGGASQTPPLPPALQRYADSGLLGGVDMIIASDVVYDAYHNQLASVVLALLAPPAPSGGSGGSGGSDGSGGSGGSGGGGNGGGWRPRAVFMLPDSRPRLRSFVAELAAAGLSCRIERVLPDCDMVRRLRAARDGWGSDASFSLYFVSPS